MSLVLVKDSKHFVQIKNTDFLNQNKVGIQINSFIDFQGELFCYNLSEECPNLQKSW
jgi:hypothetical protein